VAYRNDSVVTFRYAAGNCEHPSDSSFISEDDWNVASGKVAEISIEPKENLLVKDLGIDVKAFRKERLFRSHKNYIVFHDKARGLAVISHGDLVERVI